MQTVVIETDPKNAKGRSFTSNLLTYLEADSLWTGGQASTETIRPVWAMFAGSDSSIRPFSANLSLGKTIQVGDSHYHRGGKKINFLKTAGFQRTYQREIEGTLLNVFLPDLFVLDPGMIDPTGIRFVVLPSKQWLSQQSIDAQPLLKHVQDIGHSQHLSLVEQFVVTSFLFIAYLDRRTRCPIIMDGRFYLQFLCACLEKGLATFSTTDYYSSFGKHKSFGFREVNTDKVGMCPGIAFKACHADLEALLSEQTLQFFKHTKGE